MHTIDAHAARTADIVARLEQASARLAERIERAGDRATHATTGWSAAQIGAHVAMVNDSLRTVVDGTSRSAVPPTADFREPAWSDVLARVPTVNEAPSRLVPPTDVSGAEAVDRLRKSVERFARALSELSPERAQYCFTHKSVGTITVMQVGEFAIAHTIRHNQQAKRVLGE